MIFERGTRISIRFPSLKGSITIEDVWKLPKTSKLPVTTLESLAEVLHEALVKAQKPSFIASKKAVSTMEEQLRFDIVLHIIEVREDEERALVRKKANDDERRELRESLSGKASEKRAGMTESQLRRRLAELESQD